MAKILLVDDEPDVVAIVSARMEALGHRLTTAGDGLEALAALADGRPDLVILDLLMPGMSGAEVVQRVRGQGVRHPPILVLTGVSSPRMHEEVLMMGADDYLTKPFDVRELDRKVEKLLTRRIPSASRRASVYVLTDDPVLRSEAVRELVSRGLIPEVVIDRDGLMHRAGIERPQLLMLGAELSHVWLAVRDDPRLRDVPVILVSERREAEEQEELRRACGASGVAEKPVDWELLFDRVMRIVQQFPPRGPS